MQAPVSTGNASVATSYVSTPSAAASTPVNGLAAAASTATTNVGVTGSGGKLNVAGVNVTSAQSGVAAAQRVDSMITGAPQSKSFAHDISDAIGALASFAQSRMDAVQSKIKALMNSEGGELNAAQLQAYDRELASYEMLMQMAAKMQEKQERAIAVWVR